MEHTREKTTEQAMLTHARMQTAVLLGIFVLLLVAVIVLSV